MKDVKAALAAVVIRRPVVSGLVAAAAVVCVGMAIASPGLRLGGAVPTEEEPFSFEQTAASSGAVEPRPVADLALVDQDGRRVHLREQKGKVVVVNFITTHCAGVCVQATRDLRRLRESLGDRMGREVVFFSIGLDPEWDTAAAMREFAIRHDAAVDGWSFLTGTRDELESARAVFGAAATRGPAGASGEPTIEHTATAYVVDRQGLLRRQLPPGLLRVAGLQAIEETLGTRG